MFSFSEPKKDVLVDCHNMPKFYSYLCYITFRIKKKLLKREVSHKFSKI